MVNWNEEKELILNFGGCYSVTRLTIIRSDNITIIKE